MVVRTFSHQLLISCDRGGPEELRLRLQLLHGPNQKSVLKVPLASGASCQVLLDGRYTRLLFCLAEGCVEDEGGVEEFRGVRSKDEIAERLRELSPTGRKVDPEIVPVYVYELRSLILEKLAELDPEERGDDPAPQLLENQRGAGYRIGASGLDVVRLRPLPPRTRTHTITY
jgi:hypothetical protein